MTNLSRLWPLTKNVHAWEALAEYLLDKKDTLEKSFCRVGSTSDHELHRALGQYELINQLLKLRDQAETVHVTD